MLWSKNSAHCTGNTGMTMTFKLRRLRGSNVHFCLLHIQNLKMEKNKSGQSRHFEQNTYTQLHL